MASHDRYRFVPITDREPYDWPSGARLAVFVAVNVEHFPFGEGMGVPLAPAQPEPDVVNFSWRDYGNRVGFWRLLELFDETGVPVSFLVNTDVARHRPQIVSAIATRGDEIVAHGRTNAERQGDMSEDDERALISEVTEAWVQHSGHRPTGWMGPWVSESWVTPDLLQEAGYTYLMDWLADDQPIWMQTRRGRILSVPYPRPTNDLPMLHGHGLKPADYAEVLIDQFDEMLRQSRTQPLVYGLSLHPHVVGHAFRLKHLRRVLDHFAEHSDEIWTAHTGQIADHVIGLPDGLVP